MDTNKKFDYSLSIENPLNISGCDLVTNSIEDSSKFENESRNKEYSYINRNRNKTNHWVPQNNYYRYNMEKNAGMEKNDYRYDKEYFGSIEKCISGMDKNDYRFDKDYFGSIEKCIGGMDKNSTSSSSSTSGLVENDTSSFISRKIEANPRSQYKLQKPFDKTETSPTASTSMNPSTTTIYPEDQFLIEEPASSSHHRYPYTTNTTTNSTLNRTLSNVELSSERETESRSRYLPLTPIRTPNTSRESLLKPSLPPFNCLTQMEYDTRDPYIPFPESRITTTSTSNNHSNTSNNASPNTYDAKSFSTNPNNKNVIIKNNDRYNDFNPFYLKQSKKQNDDWKNSMLFRDHSPYTQKKAYSSSLNPNAVITTASMEYNKIDDPSPSKMNKGKYNSYEDDSSQGIKRNYTTALLSSNPGPESYRDSDRPPIPVKKFRGKERFKATTSPSPSPSPLYTRSHTYPVSDDLDYDRYFSNKYGKVNRDSRSNSVDTTPTPNPKSTQDSKDNLDKMDKKYSISSLLFDVPFRTSTMDQEKKSVSSFTPSTSTASYSSLKYTKNSKEASSDYKSLEDDTLQKSILTDFGRTYERERDRDRKQSLSHRIRKNIQLIDHLQHYLYPSMGPFSSPASTLPFSSSYDTTIPSSRPPFPNISTTTTTNTTNATRTSSFTSSPKSIPAPNNTSNSATNSSFYCSSPKSLLSSRMNYYLSSRSNYPQSPLLEPATIKRTASPSNIDDKSRPLSNSKSMSSPLITPNSKEPFISFPSSLNYFDGSYALKVNERLRRSSNSPYRLNNGGCSSNSNNNYKHKNRANSKSSRTSYNTNVRYSPYLSTKATNMPSSPYAMMYKPLLASSSSSSSAAAAAPSLYYPNYAKYNGSFVSPLATASLLKHSYTTSPWLRPSPYSSPLASSRLPNFPCLGNYRRYGRSREVVVDLTQSNIYLDMMSREDGSYSGGYIWNPEFLSKCHNTPHDSIEIPTKPVEVEDIILTEEDLKLI